MNDFIPFESLDQPSITPSRVPASVGTIGLTRESMLSGFAEPRADEGNLPNTNGTRASNLADIDKQLAAMSANHPGRALLQSERAKVAGWSGPDGVPRSTEQTVQELVSGKASGGAGGFIPFEEVIGKPSTSASGTDWSKLTDQAKKLVDFQFGSKGSRNVGDTLLGLPVRQRAADVVGAGMQLSDMFTGVLGGIYSHFGFLTGNTIGLAKGENREIAANIGQQFAGLLPGAIVAPYGELASLSPETEMMYRENPVGKAMEWFSKTVTQGSGFMAAQSKKNYDAGLSLNYLPAEWFEQAASSVMAGFGYRATATGLRRGFDAREQAALKKAAEEKAAEAQMAATLNTPVADSVATMTPEQLARWRLEQRAKPSEVEPVVQQSINNLLGIRSAAEKTKLDAARRKQTIQGYRNPTSEALPAEVEGLRGQEYVDAAEAQFRAEERLQRESLMNQNDPLAQGETTYETGTSAVPERVGQAEILRIMKKPGFERTAEDLITLRKARQEGKASPEALALLTTAGIGAAAGGLLDEDKLRGASIGGLTGVGAAMPFLSRGPSVPRNMSQAGAVKSPGGTWHPKVAEEFADPIKQKSAAGPGEATVAELSKRDVAVDRMATNYVNKYLGTERDPLKDVQIPYGQGVKAWGELTDQIISVAPAEDHPVRGPIDRITGREPFDAIVDRNPRELVWDAHNANRGDYRVSADSEDAARAINTYLQHTGDFARNIPTEKLANYDFARLVRETAANDAKVAAQAAKQFTTPDPVRVANNDALPTYRAYPEVDVPARTFEFNKPGSVQTLQKVQLPAERLRYEWKEIAVPEKLTAEQAKTVRPASGGESLAMQMERGQRSNFKEGQYIALDSTGKPIVDNFTKRQAIGPTPETAWHAGRLAEEGNAMGHCVGGYCEGVARGDSKIYSLRDQLGRSYATVEVHPKGTTARTAGPSVIDDIAQIKGPGNGKPPAYVMPFVQDFVRQGKWGEVRDLENANLKSTQHGYLTKDEIAARNLVPEADGAGGLIWTDRNGPGRNQRGSVDTKLLAGLGVTGLGALLGSAWAQDPVNGAVLGAVAGGVLGFGVQTRRGGKYLAQADTGLGMMSTRILNITGALDGVARSTPLHKAVSDYYLARMQQTSKIAERAIPFMEASVNLPKAQRMELAIALAQGDAAAIAKLAQGNRPLVDGLREVRNMLGEWGKEAQNLGRFKDLLENYFPLRVADHKGLMEHLEQPVRDRIVKLLDEANKKALRARQMPLSELEAGALINKELRGHPVPQTYQPGYAKARTVSKFTPEIMEFYHTPQEALLMTGSDVAKDLQMARLFGKDLVQGKEGGRTYINVESSLGAIAGREMAAGRLKSENFDKFKEIMNSALVNSERAPSDFIQNWRNISYMTALSDIVSAASQLGDPISTVYAQGFRPTLISIGRMLTGSTQLTVKSLGMADHIAEDLVRQSIPGSSKAKYAAVAGGVVGAAAGAYLAEDVKGALPGAVAGLFTGRVMVTGTAETLSRALHTGLFAPMDTLGKNVNLGAAVSNFQRMSRGVGGTPADIKARYGEAFGKDFPVLLDDLQNNRMTENVRSLAFMELARVQPITKFETSQAHADNPNARIMWTLKQWAQKQGDFFRREVYNKIKNGDTKTRAEGLFTLGLAGFVLAMSNAGPQFIKDFMLGRETEFKSSDIIENALKTFGLSNYVMDKIDDGAWGPVKAIGNSILPPFAIMDRIIMRDPKAVMGIPVVGKLYHDWELGGREQDEINKAKRAKRTGEERDLSDRAENYLDLKRERARAKREAAER